MGAKMADATEEQRRREMLDARRAAGAKAWSPSRAREALRRFGIGGTVRFEEAEAHGAFDNSDAFENWCFAEFGELVSL